MVGLDTGVWRSTGTVIKNLSSNKQMFREERIRAYTVFQDITRTISVVIEPKSP